MSDLEASAVYKLRKHVEQVDDSGDDDEEIGDDFENLYKGEISKSGTPILPSKRARKIPEKIQVSKEDLAELSPKPEVTEELDTETESKETTVSLEDPSAPEAQTTEANPENTDPTNT